MDGNKRQEILDPQAKRPLHVIVCGKTVSIDRLFSKTKVIDAGLKSNRHNEELKTRIVIGGRSIVVAGIPAQENYVYNIAIGAYTSDLAVIVIDSYFGVSAEIRRHSRIIASMGICHVVLAIDEMAAVEYSEMAFNRIIDDYLDFSADLGFTSIQAIPLFVPDGNGVPDVSQSMPWFTALNLEDYLEHVNVGAHRSRNAFRMPVQNITFHNQNATSISGCVAEGQVCAGDIVRILPSGVLVKVESVIGNAMGVDIGHTGDLITLALEEKVQIYQGDVLVSTDNQPEMADQFEARLLWVSERTMTPGRQYLMRLADKEVTATITEIKYIEDIDIGAHLAGKVLKVGEIATVNLSTSAPLVFEPYKINRILGGFTLVDKEVSRLVGVGMISFALRRSSNIHWQALELSKATRAAQKHQLPKCIWFTGLSGSGKSTIANQLEKRLHVVSKHTYLLDGDNVRHGLNRDLGFTEVDRVENIRRVAEVAKLMVDAGLIVLVSFISPFRSERSMARGLFADGEFVEVFVDTPIEACELRDVKGLYAKARNGELKNFTGIDSPYEPPESPEIRLLTANTTPEACAEKILKLIDLESTGNKELND